MTASTRQPAAGKIRAATRPTNNRHTMRGAVIYEPRRARIEQVELRKPQPGEVLVRVEGCGVCASNIPVWEGREWFSYPLDPGAPGHEAWGVVAATGEGAGAFEVGQRVAILSQHGFAEYDTVTHDLALPLPRELDGKPFPGEPLVVR